MSSVVLTGLECDGRKHCYNRADCGILGTIHSTKVQIAEARRIAQEKLDWEYRKVGHSFYDLCPECKDHPKIEQIIKQREE